MWYADTAYDTTLRVALDGATSVTATPPFMATAVDVMLEGEPPTVTAISREGTRYPSEPRLWYDDDSERMIVRYTLDEAIEITSVEAAGTDATLHALTLVDTRTGDFQQVTLDGWRRVLSSDIEIYESNTVLPRAFVVHRAWVVPDTLEGTETALMILREPTFDPAQAAVINSENAAALATGGSGTAEITHYSATEIRISVETDTEGYVILTDAYYPGWIAEMDGVPAPLHRADVMFRAVQVTAGRHEVVLAYRPSWLAWLPLLGGGWLLVIGFWWLNRKH